MCRDNVDYVIMNRHWKKDRLPLFDFVSLKCNFRIRILIEGQLMRSSEPQIMSHFLWYKIDYYRSGHFRTCIWPCLTVRNTCLSLDLTILEYGSEQFKNKVINHDNAGKSTGLSCKLYIHLFPIGKCVRDHFQVYATTAHAFLRLYIIYFLLRMHFVYFSRHCLGSFSGWLAAVMMRSKLGSMFRMSLWYFWQRQAHEFIKVLMKYPFVVSPCFRKHSRECC